MRNNIGEIIAWLKRNLPRYTNNQNISESLYKELELYLNKSTSQETHFLNNCFIRTYSDELLKKLELMGYKINCRLSDGTSKDDVYIDCCEGSVYSLSSNISEKRLLYNSFDCGTNEQLFLALAAMRDDNDYMQWFVHDEPQQWVNIDRWVNVGDMFIVMTEHNQCDWKCHKASVDELINYFKK